MEVVSIGMPFLIGLVLIAVAFDFLNGLHDAANSIATVVTTRVLSPKAAVAWAAFFNFIAFMFFGLSVAATIGKGVVAAGVADPYVVGGALTGAIFWNVVTWLRGIPSSSSHALVGGLIGAAMAKAGPAAVMWSGVRTIATWIVLSPLIGMMLAMLLVLITSWVCRRMTPYSADRRFRVLQFVSSSMFSLGHGANDAQKTMGIISILLYSQGMLGNSFYVPFWVVLLCQTALAAGTFFGGWKIVRTMGSRITELKPMGGFCAETGGALTLFGATWLGIPVSTTHTITGAIVGVGAAKRASAVRWGVARRIGWAWIITLPAAGLVGASGYFLLRMIAG